MQFLKEIEAHLVNYATDAKEEIQKFISYLWTKYPETKDAVIPPPAPLSTTPTIAEPIAVTPTFTVPVTCTPVEITTIAEIDETPEETIVDPVSTTCAPAPEAK